MICLVLLVSSVAIEKLETSRPATRPFFSESRSSLVVLHDHWLYLGTTKGIDVFRTKPMYIPLASFLLFFFFCSAFAKPTEPFSTSSSVYLFAWYFFLPPPPLLLPRFLSTSLPFSSSFFPSSSLPSSSSIHRSHHIYFALFLASQFTVSSFILVHPSFT